MCMIRDENMNGIGRCMMLNARIVMGKVYEMVSLEYKSLILFECV